MRIAINFVLTNIIPTILPVYFPLVLGALFRKKKPVSYFSKIKKLFARE